MENFLLFPLSIILPIFALALFYYTLKPPKHERLPPGTFGWPIIGETFAFVNQDHDKFVAERMRKYSPKIFKTKILGEKTVVLCGTSGHKFVASNEEKLFLAWRPHSMQKLFRSSYQKVNSAAIPRQAEVQIMKAPGFLRPESLFKYVEVMDSLVAQHFDKYWARKGVIEVHHLAQLLVLTLSGRFFLGLDDPNRIQKLSKLLDTMMFALHVIPLDFPGTIFHRAMVAAKAVRKDLQLLIREKRAAMAAGVKMNDVLSFMINNPDPNGRYMPENEIADKVMGLVAAAFNSPAMTTAFIVKYLGQRPDIYDKVRSEQEKIGRSKKEGERLNWEDMQKMKYSWNVALEVMRLIPPLQGTFREAAADITYEGYTIPKGWKVYWTVSTTSMDPEHFPAPVEFDPARYEKSSVPPYTNIPFGSGPRICPGKDYARLQILTFMHHLVTKFKWDVLNPNCKVLGGMNPIPIQGLQIRLH
ncbi:Cytochrome P450, E-class, group I [Parasponia andersonii]|uniref:Cytochrome P450, E-class, group I n=1 Tax=Parasponia andersonii TaxID=3476 RepID=A0A2P5D568_PARAD|nr:Cytochrome P450, E-class, group I [Parasponia andersonii]